MPANQSLIAQWEEAGDKTDVVMQAVERLLQSMDRVNDARDADEGARGLISQLRYIICAD